MTECKFIYGKAFGSGDGYRIYDVTDNGKSYYELQFNEEFVNNFETFDDAKKHGEDMYLLIGEKKI